MVTRWGTCNTEKKKLWFNLQLAQKPIECLEYVILHELIHLRERTHNSTSALTDNQSFTISSADLFKAYCLNKDFRKAIDTGKFVYVEGHVCLDDEKYIIHSEGRVKLTQYALSHMDECCLAFDKGYSYQSKYQGQKYYVQMMYKTPSQVAAQEYSFEMNAHNRTLLSQIQRASRSADAMRLYPGAFSETLVQLMKEKKLSNKKLADASLVGERTIQRLRNEEEYPTTVQTVLGLCYGLQLSVPEAEMLVGKTDFNIKPTNPQNNAYRCVLSSCAENSIYEVNEMLYEKFILEYYRKEFKNQFTANASQIPWQLDNEENSMLPVMQSDIMLQSGEKVLIIDAKYYEHSTQVQFDKHTLHSGNLYQIFTYVKNKEYELREKNHTVSGMLLYAKTDEEIYPNNVYQMSGNQITVRTLDLNLPFDEIAGQLNTIAKTHFDL